MVIHEFKYEHFVHQTDSLIWVFFFMRMRQLIHKLVSRVEWIHFMLQETWRVWFYSFNALTIPTNACRDQNDINQSRFGHFNFVCECKVYKTLAYFVLNIQISSTDPDLWRQRPRTVYVCSLCLLTILCFSWLEQTRWTRFLFNTFSLCLKILNYLGLSAGKLFTRSSVKNSIFESFKRLNKSKYMQTCIPFSL